MIQFILIFIPVVDFEVEVLGEGIEVGPIVEEVLGLRRQVTLAIAEDAVVACSARAFSRRLMKYSRQ